MKTKSNNKFNQETIDLIINSAYGSAGLITKIKAWFLIRKNVELKNLYNEYKRTAKSVHSLDKDEMPDYVLQKLESKTGIELNTNETSFISDLTSILFAKPQLAFIATAVIIGVLLSSVLFKEPQIENNYSPSEIELANKQTREALAIVSRIFSSTQTKLTNEIIPNNVAKPINESFDYVNNLFKKGDI